MSAGPSAAALTLVGLERVIGGGPTVASGFLTEQTYSNDRTWFLGLMGGVSSPSDHASALGVW
ncbi:hypothetical protein B9Q04_08470 [Candidatus Marsarchaeota G2 archaeon BE_D]|uniref:Uncharacterized protein n=3 Tax=Candidatus Marsarchaeota group 2 TaxID=2203771 RepID=A0A2R6CAT6_9ARCH|nr:MAG: hypothetical protein B9Q07_11465 [Candidatus Marsarchaeota G2 archaeon ECH_B_3]PSO01216.1 MAG: hypothetical protein B9Q05_09060 [Candidatus Marsarchaeota G2 archaeon ECH_B_1]PSO07886.1 MAG: hypothetical protein B9Q04_08470 [Candidatus Marsarchaeota G2 archaeon BE_D]